MIENETEGLERSIVLAGLDALRHSGGDGLVRTILGSAQERIERNELPYKVPIVDYLRYRDAALEYLGTRFEQVAFATGRNLVRSFHDRAVKDIQLLVDQFDGSANKLPLIGQAAVLASKGNPGVVRAAMSGTSRLVITIEDCPECRWLVRDTPFCYLNQGIITEFAERYARVRVHTQETSCMATGAPVCEIEVATV